MLLFLLRFSSSSDDSEEELLECFFLDFFFRFVAGSESDSSSESDDLAFLDFFFLICEKEKGNRNVIGTERQKQADHSITNVVLRNQLLL